MQQAPDYLIAEYTPVVADETVAVRKRRMISGIVSLVLSLVISAVFVVWRWDAFRTSWEPWVFVGLATVLSAVRLVVWLVGWRRAVADRAKVGVGPALVIGRFGVELHGVRLSWPEVAQLAIGPGGLGRGPDITVRSHSGPPLTIGLEHVDVKPATVEAATRIYSDGRASVDLSRLDD
ncbi:hypothetical protein DT076_18685 [Desertihabitans brevis]|uniref:PH domain-containing protein n=1 Tax=Desertihabitans brevis TaxID=2268447 RepID=A0A367YQZ7_9ACTN|nr:hypothetical protein [Desertihabitans brevis]RCK67969.1 hypothetical protein DT076_18685 [Desertihabitans brevis]